MARVAAVAAHEGWQAGCGAMGAAATVGAVVVRVRAAAAWVAAEWVAEARAAAAYIL